MISETIYVGRDNTFSLQLVRGGEPITLLSITGYKLVIDEDSGFMFEDLILDESDPDPIFKEKADGIVEISIGTRITDDYLGRWKAYLITYDPINEEGVRWPPFYLKVQ